MAKVVKVCPICGEEFEAKRKEQICCSDNCRHIYSRKKETRICPNCGKSFEIRPSTKKVYCSKECCSNAHSKDITGQKFGRLTVIRFDHKEKRIKGGKGFKHLYLCKCDCGNEVIVDRKSLTAGNTKSCGCIKDERVKNLNATHHLSKTRLYFVWKNIRKRCYNEKYKDYKYYGGKGIKMCDEWKDNFMAFHQWAYDNNYDDKAPRGLYTIDRIDFNGNYEPSNCRFITIQEQQRNKSQNHFITYNNKTMILCDWAKEFNIPPKTLQRRLAANWDIEKALTTPVKH